jgi:hypothetical protein
VGRGCAGDDDGDQGDDEHEAGEAEEDDLRGSVCGLEASGDLKADSGDGEGGEGEGAFDVLYKREGVGDEGAGRGKQESSRRGD